MTATSGAGVDRDSRTIIRRYHFAMAVPFGIDVLTSAVYAAINARPLTLVPLAATSTTWAIRKLGGRNWNRLHKLVYLAAICGIVHYWWQVKPGVMSPLKSTIAVVVLLSARPILKWWKNSRCKPVPQPA